MIEAHGRRRALQGALAAIVLLTLGGCALFFQNPTVRIVDVRVASLGLASGSAEVALEVVNPNRYALHLQSFDYILEIENGRSESGWTELGTGRSDESIPVAGRDTTHIRFEVPFTYRAIQTALSAYLRDGQVAYRFRGDAVVRGPGGRYDVPFDRRGNF